MYEGWLSYAAYTPSIYALRYLAIHLRWGLPLYDGFAVISLGLWVFAEWVLTALRTIEYERVGKVFFSVSALSAALACDHSLHCGNMVIWLRVYRLFWSLFFCTEWADGCLLFHPPHLCPLVGCIACVFVFLVVVLHGANNKATMICAGRLIILLLIVSVLMLLVLLLLWVLLLGVSPYSIFADDSRLLFPFRALMKNPTLHGGWMMLSSLSSVDARLMM